MKDCNHTASRLLIVAGGLMGVSGLLLCACGAVPYGGLLFAASSCMFSAARNVRIAENKKAIKDMEEMNHDEETV